MSSFITGYKTTLSSSVTSTDSTIPVSSITTPDGHTISMSDLGPVAYLVIEPGAANQEIISVTGISGTSWTGATRGLAFYGDSASSVAANKKAHNAGSVVIMSNVHLAYELFVDKNSAETITGIKTFDTGATPLITDQPTTNLQAANKLYVDTVAIQGAPNASATTKGISKLSSSPASPTNPIALNSEEVSATSAANKVVRANASGYIDAGFGGAASTLATLDGSGNVVQDPANATETPTAFKIVKADFSGKLNKWINNVQTNAFTTGAAIDGSTTPQLVAIKAADGLVYKSDANDPLYVQAFGFITTNALISTTPYIVMEGILGGFTGLTPQAAYYASDTPGAISLTPSITTVIPVGIAISSTQLLVRFGKKKAFGTITHSTAVGATDNQTVNCGFQPSLITYYFKFSTANISSAGVATWDTTTGVAASYLAADTSGTAITSSNIANFVSSVFTSNAIRVAPGSGTDRSRIDTSPISVSATGFVSRQINTLISGAGSTGTGSIQYIIEE